ncbi:MAG: phosphatidylserine decarboxylase [Vicinamibacterales bacterium]
MWIDRAAGPFVVLAAIPAVVSAFAGALTVAAALLVLPIAIALFFRDPGRTPPPDPRAVVAPADGRVMFAGEAPPASAPDGAWRQVTIFLSIFDVHINRTPVAGRVTRVDHVPGSFLPAYRPEARRNEHSEIWLDHRGQTVVTRQVVGVLARRVVCRVKRGDDLAAGARIGLMKFGSRMDVFVPPSAELLVTTGQTVRGGETVIARLTAGD